MDNKKIGTFIAKMRKAKGYTQQELGNMLYVTDKAVSKWERGLSIPDVALLEKLAQILDTTIYDILQISKQKEDDLVQLIEDNNLKLRKAYKKRMKLMTVCFSIICISFMVVVLIKPKWRTLIIKEIETENKEPTIKEVTKKYLSLNTYLKANQLTDLDTSIIYIDNNTIYGTAQEKVEDGYGKTKALFRYNLLSDSFNEVKINEEQKIVDFKVWEQEIYFINLIGSKNGIKWQLEKSDLNFKKKQVLAQGNILNEDYPKLILNNKELFLLAKNVKEEKEMTNLYSIKDNKLTTLLTYEGNWNNQTGDLLEIYNTQVFQDKIWFNLNNETNNTLYCYDLQKRELTPILAKAKDEVTFKKFICNSQTCIMNVVIDNTDKLLSITSKAVKIENMPNLARGQALNADYLLFQDNRAFNKTPYKWYLYNTDKQQWLNLTSLFDSYWLVLNENAILINENNEYYMIEDVLSYNLN